MKMKERFVKALALAAILALCLGLSSCYIAPEDLSGDPLTIGNNAAPFDPLDPPTSAPTNRPTATPTATLSGQFNSQPGLNWNDDWNQPLTTNASGMIQLITPGVGGNVFQPQGQATTTIRPTATPKPTPTPAPTSLKLGTTGTPVRTVQQRLKNLGYYSGSVDGDFGEATQEAVMAFQRQNGLTVDGKVGENTLAKLNSSSARRAPSPTPTATKTPKPTATPNLNNARYLKVGVSGSDVRQLQSRLIYLGWLNGKADGEFGGATEAAVKAFQSATNGLWADGIAGPDTQKALYATNARTSSSPSASIGETLELNSEGAAVRALQKRLKELGYLNDSVDGKFGQATKAAVIAFQTVNKLTVDGRAGTGTLNKLYSDSALSASAGLTPTRTPTRAPASDSGSTSNSGNSGSQTNTTVSSTGYTTLRQGDESTAVERLQRALKNLGYYNGTVDGKYGAGTVEAVKTFQRMNRITVDGTAGPQTQRILYGTSATSLFDTIRPGDEGSAVTNLQYTLYELGYYDGKINGVYNDLTKDAVRAFQIRNEVTPVDGIAGNKTLQAMYSSTALSATAVGTKFETLRRGDSGNAVVELQDCLMQLGYLGTITGEYDEATFWAVKSFQERNGLDSDGVAGNETQQVLYSDSAKRAY